jgi:hypothetical protein
MSLRLVFAAVKDVCARKIPDECLGFFVPSQPSDYSVGFCSGRVKFLSILFHYVHKIPRTSSPNSLVFCSRKGATYIIPSLAVARSKAVCFLKISGAYFCNGKPICRNNASHSAFVLAVVTSVMDIPKTSLSSSSAVSGKIECSLIPSV